MDKALVLGGEVRREPVFEAMRIPPESYIEYWPNISCELDRIPHVWQSHWTKESLFECGMSGKFQIWGFGLPTEIHVIVFTQVIEFPASRILQVFLAFGNSIELALPVMEATLEKFAMVAECNMVEVIGRKGWGRKLPEYKEKCVVLQKNIANMGVH